MSTAVRLLPTSTGDKPTGARHVYQSMLAAPSAPENRINARAYLRRQLQQAACLPCTMPLNPRALGGWISRNSIETGEKYSRYLESRRSGQPRQYFQSRAHALSFLQRVAPTKLVDGAWLYGALQHWPDSRFHPLIRTYLEELGNGDPTQNHVVLYQQLLARYGCEPLPELSDDHYLQGALQLALGYGADEFMPEMIGYNLGYETLPLHLLITAFELDELGIDPYYFTLHVTIDNASTGHARKAVQALLNTLPSGSDASPFLERIANGYRLNELGVGSTDVVESFDQERELVAMLERKSAFGKHLHSDFCRIGGRTVNEWLASPDRVRGFLQALTEKGWLKRHQDPQHSRFWRLVEGREAPMFGVFSPFEKQLLHDWIAGDWLSDGAGTSSPSGGARRTRRSAIYRHNRAPGSPLTQDNGRPGNIDHDVRVLEQELDSLSETPRMHRLVELMAPSTHATAAGLLATRRFAEALH